MKQGELLDLLCNCPYCSLLMVASLGGSAYIRENGEFELCSIP